MVTLFHLSSQQIQNLTRSTQSREERSDNDANVIAIELKDNYSAKEGAWEETTLTRSLTIPAFSLSAKERPGN